jgi:heptosyltransferase-2
MHEVDRNLSMIEDLISKHVRRPYLDITDDIRNKIASYQSKKYYCLAPSSVWKTKEAPVVIWEKLIDQLNTAQDCQIFLLGGPDDYEKSEILKKNSASKNIINLCGKLSLIESAALMQNAQRNYVNDSAPLHLASAVNAPVSVFFCSTSPSFGFGPLSDDSKIIEVQDLECKPCGLHGHKACPKGHFRCGNELELS